MINEDLLLTLTGGDVVHIGSIIMYDHQNKEMTINNFLSHDERYHKDGMLGEKLISQIKRYLPGNCVILCGVHINNITHEQITESFKLTQKLGNKIIDWLNYSDFTFKKPYYTSH